MDSEPSVSEVVGGNLAVLRQAVGLTQEQLATAMAKMGFRWHRQTVTEVEAGERPTSIEEVVALAAFLELQPEALIIGPGGDVTYPGVRVGNAALRVRDWVNLWSIPDLSGPSEGFRRIAINRIVGKLERPWARIWRQRGGSIVEAFGEAYELAMARRRRFPGPIFVSEEDIVVQTSRPPWGHGLQIVLKAGVPYSARNETEARVLAQQEVIGFVRRVTRQQAYRIRKAKGGSS